MKPESVFKKLFFAAEVSIIPDEGEYRKSERIRYAACPFIEISPAVGRSLVTIMLFSMWYAS